MATALGMGWAMAGGCELHNFQGVRGIFDQRLWPLAEQLRVHYDAPIEDVPLDFNTAEGDVLAFVGTDDGGATGGGFSLHEGLTWRTTCLATCLVTSLASCPLFPSPPSHLNPCFPHAVLQGSQMIPGPRITVGQLWSRWLPSSSP